MSKIQGSNVFLRNMLFLLECIIEIRDGVGCYISEIFLPFRMGVVVI